MVLECKYCAVSRLCIPAALDDVPKEVFNHTVHAKMQIEKGDLLFKKGDDFKYFYAIKSGSFKASNLTEDGREQITSFFFAGELIGFDAVSSDCCNSNLEAIETAFVCLISYEKLLELSRQSFSLQRHIIKLMSQRIRYDGCIRAKGKAHEKVANFLINFINRINRKNELINKVRLPMSRTDIGCFLGLTSETVTRSLSAFKQKGILTCAGKDLIIKDRSLLEEMAGN